MRLLGWSTGVLAIGFASAWLWAQTQPTPAPASQKPALHARVSSAQAPVRPVLSQAVATAPVKTASDREQELAARFASERADPAWAEATRAELDADLGRFTSKDAGLRTIECRASLCRVELVVASRESGAAFIQEWARDRRFDGPIHGAQDNGKLVMYLGRLGTEL